MTQQTTVQLDNKTLSVISHLGGILAGFLVPLIVWLMIKDNKSQASVAVHAKEALNFQITVLMGSFVGILLSFILIGFLVWPLVYILNLVFSIQAAIAASNNKDYIYPYSIRLIK